jgi:hypothetical protein
MIKELICAGTYQFSNESYSMLHYLVREITNIILFDQVLGILFDIGFNIGCTIGQDISHYSLFVNLPQYSLIMQGIHITHHI